MPTTLERLSEAVNSHDAERMATLFAEDYASSQPVHPGRGFGGRAQVAKNWTALFEAVPDFTAEVVSSSITGNLEWAEWDWHGQYLDGSPFAMQGRNDHGHPRRFDRRGTALHGVRRDRC